MNGLRIVGGQLTVQPISPALGAEVRGLDLSRPICDQRWREIQDALLRHQVLFFRNQPLLSPEHQISFGRRLGELHLHPAAPSLAGYPEVMVVHADGNSKRHFGEVWHSDVSCDIEPPSYTILQVQVIPPAGGDTLFAGMYAAFQALSSPMQSFLAGLTADHESEHFYRGRYQGIDDANRVYPRAVHPVIRTHPETGRPCLFVNQMFTTRIREVTARESRAVLDLLFEHIRDPYYQIRFQWRENDVAVWDNRCTQHLAIWDYWPNRRTGHRVTVRGSRPSFNPGA